MPGAHAHAGSGFAAAFELFSRAKVVVGGDTGLLHLAGACGVPVVMVFGPTDPDDGFFVYPGAAVSRELACRPCSLHGANRCPLVIQRCMNIGSERIVAAIAEIECAG
jgi:heptosyltransferase-2